MSERLTEEQVAAALELGDYMQEESATFKTLYRAMAQLHADLEAARRSVQGLCVQLDETQEERNLAEGQRDRAASALSSLREAAMEAVETAGDYTREAEHMRAVARLRSLLEVKA